ncbi:UNVERIFIED_CONTAM: hypothetical protein NCL1_51099 [Trichonephila clavipes]
MSKLMYFLHFEKITWKLTLCFGWIVYYISMWIFYDVLYFSEESLLKHIAYNGFGGILFSCCMGWVFHVCTTKQAGE